MKKSFLYTLPFFALAIGTGWLLLAEKKATTYQEEDEKLSKEQRIDEMLKRQFEMTKDPALGYPPHERLLKAYETTKRLQAEMEYGRNPGNITEARWRERGPNNIGGRTRTIMIDKNDPTRNTVWVGGVSGGLWKSTDVSLTPANWVKVNDYMDNISVGDLDQDSNNPQIMYLATGEWYAGMPGLAIFKSTDGGSNWAALPSTVNATFQYTQDIFVHPITSDIYAATHRGLWRSQDGGTSWTKILGLDVGGVQDGMHDIDYHKASNTIFVANHTSIFKSQSGAAGSWENITLNNGFMSGVSRVEMSVSQSSPYVIYAVGNNNGQGTALHLKNENGNWIARSTPTDGNGVNYARDQGGYDLEVTVDPFDDQRIVIGGIDLYMSENGGFSFNRISHWTGADRQYVHADQHKCLFDDETPGVIFFGNDGGIWRTSNYSNITDRNKDYNVTQFYACAIHPEFLKDYFLGGTQDNGSLQLNQFGIDDAREVLGGDGFFCHIDENEPDIQMVSLYFGAYALSTDGGKNFGSGAETDGGFVNPSDYDNENNILYTETNSGDYWRWHVTGGGQSGPVDIDGVSPNVTAVTVDPNVPNRVYFGTSTGRIIRVNNAHEGTTVSGTVLSPSTAGWVGNIDIEIGNPDHLLVTLSNFGIANIKESFDGGNTWVTLDGNLPDMPVHWGIFNPNDPTQAIIGTEFGAWTTDLLDGANTQWMPPVPGKGTPLTRVTMLQLRRSDKMVLASTYGRGLWTTDVFSDPYNVLEVDRVHYTQSPLEFRGERSLNAGSFFWELGDGITSDQENASREYAQPGTYNASLTINGDLREETSIKILPDRPLPYLPDTEAYSGSFEKNEEQFGVYTISGSSFERGNSSVSGKDGTHSGNNAFVIGLNEEYYQPNTHTILYLPNFDFSEQGIYEFSFWAKYKLHAGFDGLQVQYSTDRGQSWRVLGSADNENWYNFSNDTEPTAAFSIGNDYFSGTRLGFTPYSLNISNLAGNESVAFRFVFKSEGSGNHTGIVIDDVEITKYADELVTKVVKFEGDYASSSDILLEWNTQPEYKCTKFEIEQSFNGKNFEVIGSVEPEGRTSTELHSYSFTTLGQRNLYFFRIKVYNEDPSIDYEHIFYTPTLVIRRENIYTGQQVLNVSPNPFTNLIEMTFTDVLDGDVNYMLHNAAGQVILQGKQKVEGAFMQLDTPRLPAGVYFLSVTIGDNEVQTFKLLAN
ncbi:MAG TPA: T9SS type A sorting domain-containing protein [Saprospiraceae bacterium]|nr:T9SS type A sorting domain-containing protein [Saprospiraceae bacterium]HMQ82943.1 T9SS type A sorting domain-containing protein [Saprospiraceae bacterium]